MGNAGGTTSLLGAALSQATSGQRCRMGQKGTSCDVVHAPLCPPQTPLSPTFPLQLLVCQPQCQPWGKAQLWGMAELHIMARPCPHVPAQLCSVSSCGMPIPSTCSTHTPLHQGCPQSLL